MRLILKALIIAAAAIIPSICEATSISLSPPTSTVNPGQAFSLDVDVNNVTDLYAFQFTVDFDPAVLQAVSASEGSFLPGGGTTFFIPGTIDNVGGSITFLADSLIGLIPGVSGSGQLASVGFDVKPSASLGTTSISLLFDAGNGDGLLDSSLANIAADAVGGSATVQTAVPEPATLTLFGTASLALIGRRRRAHRA
jgi:hypothetical protein